MFSIRCVVSKLHKKVVPAEKNVLPALSQIRKKSVVSRASRFFFHDNLLVTNSLSSGLFMVIGDLVQQEIEYRHKILSGRYDWVRTARMFTVGTLLGPCHHYYYITLDKLLPKATFLTAIQKILCDQVFASPLTIICFFYGMGIIEGKSLHKIMSEIRDKFLYVYIGDCMFWPPVQFINFYFLPTKFRVFYINGATMIFNIFLSYMKHDFHN